MHAQPRQFAPEGDEFHGGGIQLLEIGAPVRFHQMPPRRHVFFDLRDERLDADGELRRGFSILGHVDTARIHNDGINQRIGVFAQHRPLSRNLGLPDNRVVALQRGQGDDRNGNGGGQLNADHQEDFRCDSHATQQVDNVHETIPTHFESG